MKVRQHYVAIYVKEDDIQPRPGGGPIVKWNKVHHIKRFPRLIQGTSSANFIFSPDFDFFIDIDYKMGNFVIRKAEDESIFKRIPQGLINLNIGTKGKSKVAIQRQGSRMMFLNERILRIISKEGFDVLLDIGDD